MHTSRSDLRFLIPIGPLKSQIRLRQPQEQLSSSARVELLDLDIGIKACRPDETLYKGSR